MAGKIETTKTQIVMIKDKQKTMYNGCNMQQLMYHEDESYYRQKQQAEDRTQANVSNRGYKRTRQDLKKGTTNEIDQLFVAIMARKNLNLVDVGHCDNSRILAVIIKATNVKTLLIAVYMPTGTTGKNNRVPRDCDKIAGIIEDHGRGRMVIVGGDLNVDLTTEAHSNKKYMEDMMSEYRLVIPSKDINKCKTFYRNETEGYPCWITS